MKLISNDGELVVVETLRQEICFSALSGLPSRSRSTDIFKDRRLILLFLCVSCDPRLIYHSDFVFHSNCCIRPLQPTHSTVSIKTLKRGGVLPYD